MKKKVLVLLLAFVMLIVLGLVFKEFISASIFDTLAVSQVTTPTVTLDAYPPDLTLDSPTSTNYTTSNIDINYSVSDSGSGVNTVWYNLDGGSNTTLTENVTTTVANGDHTLFIYANDSVGLVNDSEFVSFIVSVADSTPPDLIVDSPTSTTYTTSSVDIKYSVLEAESSVDTVWYNLDGGSNNTLTANTTITVADGSHNFYIYANNTAGLVDSESVSFTVSTAVTPPGPTGQAAGGGGGGGKKVPSLVSDFRIIPSLIVLELKPGETKSQIITIKNTGEAPLKGVIELRKLERFAILSSYEFELEPKQEKDVSVVFVTPIGVVPDVYPGEIIAKAGDKTERARVIIEVETEKTLFDVNMSIPLKYKKILPGENTKGYITFINMKKAEKVDVNAEYVIKNMNDEIIDVKTETLAVHDILSVVKDMETPKDIKLGDYVFYVRASYDGQVATASDLFSVVSREEMPSWLAQQLSKISYSRLIIVVIALMLLIILIVLVRKKRKKKVKPILKQKVKEKPFKEEALKEKGELKKLVDHIRNNLK